MGFWSMVQKDFEMCFPESLKVVRNKKTGEFAFELVNKPNPYVPTHVSHYENGDFEVHLAGNVPQTSVKDLKWAVDDRWRKTVSAKKGKQQSLLGLRSR